MVVLVCYNQIGTRTINQYECLSTDNLDFLLPELNVSNVGSSAFAVDTGDIFKLNVDKNNALKWYKI